MRESRRRFVKLALLSGGLAPCAAALALGDEIETGCDEQLTAQRRQIGSHYEKNQLTWLKHLKEKLGPQAVEATRQYTIDRTRERFEKAGLDSRDLAAVKSLLWDNLDDRFGFTMVEETAEKLEYRVDRCYLAEMARELGATAEGFALFCAWDIGFCRGLNPDLEFSRTETLMTGHSCCNHTYRLGKG